MPGGRFRLEVGPHDEPTGAVAFMPDGTEKRFGPGEKIVVPAGTRVEKTSKMYMAPAEFDSISDLDKKFNQYDKAGRCVSRKFTRIGAEDQVVTAQAKQIEDLRIENELKNNRMEKLLESMTSEQLRAYAEGEEIPVDESMSREDLIAVIRGA